MPSISQKKLDELVQERDTARSKAAVLQGQLSGSQAQVASIDSILDKVTRAAQGRPIKDARPGYGNSNDTYFGLGSGVTTSWGLPTPENPTKAQLRHLRESEQRERIVNLEARLSAVIAVAQFAKEHKS